MGKTTKQILCFILTVFCFQPFYAQWVLQQKDIQAEFRGLCVVNEKVVWVSGSNNTYARTIDGGSSWEVHTVADSMKLDFRDVEAFSADVAFLLSIGSGAKSRIYKTVDGGKNWQLQFENKRQAAFFDAFTFWDEQNGMAMSDIVDGKLLLIKTNDGGAHWTEIPQKALPPGLPNEGGFAASGTCIVTQGTSNVWICTSGGSRIYRSNNRGDTWTVVQTPLIKDTPSSGIFSISFYDAENGIAVGGDYQKENEAKDNIAITSDGGITWKLLIDSKLGGFRSSVAYVPGTKGMHVVAVGPLGTDYSKDGGWHWVPFDEVGFHVLGFAKEKTVVWGAGRGGRIAKSTIERD